MSIFSLTHTTNDDVFEMTIQVAQGLKSFEEIKEWFEKNSISR